MACRNPSQQLFSKYGWTVPRRQAPVSTTQIRTAVNSANAAKYRRSDAAGKPKKKKQNTDFTLPNLKQAEQFSLCDAMRYIRAFEVGRPPSSAKYEMAVRLRTPKNGPVVRNRFRLPHPVTSDMRICVICQPGSKHAKIAEEAGAVLVGEDVVFEAVKAGNIDFDRMVCHADSLAKLNQAGLGRILGPRGLMPSAKTGTVVKDVGPIMKDLIGGSEYRERVGVIRLAIGQLEFTPEQMHSNIRAFMNSIRSDCAQLSDRVAKEVHEVVLSSTRSPGFSLNGDIQTSGSEPQAMLAT